MAASPGGDRRRRLALVARLAARSALLASAIYLVGCIGVTIVGNVPLNNALAAASPRAHREAASLWTRYLDEWTRWNTVRTLASAVSAILFTVALVSKE